MRRQLAAMDASTWRVDAQRYVKPTDENGRAERQQHTVRSIKQSIGEKGCESRQCSRDMDRLGAEVDGRYLDLRGEASPSALAVLDDVAERKRGLHG